MVISPGRVLYGGLYEASACGVGAIAVGMDDEPERLGMINKYLYIMLMRQESGLHHYTGTMKGWDRIWISSQGKRLMVSRDTSFQSTGSVSR